MSLPNRGVLHAAAASFQMKCVKSDYKIYTHAVAATPSPLLQALCQRVMADSLTGIKLFHLHVTGNAPWTDERLQGAVEVDATVNA